MDPAIDTSVIWNFATALLIGAMLGIEREKHKRSESESIGGLRTFILFALIGALGGWLTQELGTPWILVAAITATTATVVAGYLLTARSGGEAVGLTTELAAVAACLLGALAALGQRELAVALAVVVAASLAYKQPLHGLVDRLDPDDVFAGLRLLIATFIILPLLPDEPIDPWGALNPRSLWILALLIASLSLVGYVATRLLGANRGIPLTGLAGGLVSSTAVTLSFARQSREPEYARASSILASGILLAWSMMFIRVIIEVLVVNRSLLGSILTPFFLMAAVAAVFAWYYRRQAPSVDTTQGIPLKNPFSLRSASKFAAFFALVLLIVKLVETYAPDRGLYYVAALAGTTDVDAITLSLAQYARDGSEVVAARGITLAALSNTLVKGGIVAVLGSRSLRRPLLLATAAILAVGGIALALI
jgi:uncharacterized membrane protein (DUF4010 family)